MSIYKELNPLINYIDSIRRLENYIVFDIKFPLGWKVLKKYIVEDKFVNNGTNSKIENVKTDEITKGAGLSEIIADEGQD